MTRYWSAEPSTLESSRDSKKSINTIRSAIDMANTANQYRIFPTNRTGLQA
jgi:hypothetical protein